MPLNPFAGEWQIFGLYSIEFPFLLVLHPRTARLMDERAEKVGLLTHNTASRTFKSNPHENTAFLPIRMPGKSHLHNTVQTYTKIVVQDIFTAR